MERALNATDQFLDTVLQDKNRLKDPYFMMYLMRIRQKHKKTFAVIDELFSSHSVTPIQIHRTDLVDEKCCDDDKDAWIVDDERKRSRSVQIQRRRMREERRFEYAEEQLLQIANSTDNNKKLHLRNNAKSTRIFHSWRFINELKEKKKFEETEEKKKVAYLRNRVREVPRSTYEPRYQQLCEKEQHARQIRCKRAVEMPKKVRFPRMAAKFEPESFHLRRCISAEASDWDKREAFKAKDVPLSVYLSPYKDEIQACKRARQKMERAAELIRTSRAPPGLEKHAIQSRIKHRLREAKYCMDQEPNRNICYSRTVPNFKKLHELLLNKLEKAASSRPVTVVKPFYFQTDERMNNHKCNHENLLPRIDRRSYSTGNLREYDGPRIRLNHASLLRSEANRIRVQKMESEQNCSQKFWESMKKRGELARIKLKQKLGTEFTTNCDIQRRLKEKKTKEQERADEYRNELKAMKRRVRARAFIVEQQEMLIKMQRFERKYKEIVKGMRSKTRKIDIQKQYPNIFKQKMTMTNFDQQTMIISTLDQSNEAQTSKTEANSDSLFILDSDDKGNEEHVDEDNDNDGSGGDNIDHSNGGVDYDSDYDEDDNSDGDNDDGDDGDDGDVGGDGDDNEDSDDVTEYEESENDNDGFNESFESKNSESSSDSQEFHTMQKKQTITSI